MALLSALEALVVADGNYDWNDVFHTLDGEVSYAIYNGDQAILANAIAAEFPLLNAASVTAAIASDVNDISSAVNGAAISPVGLAADGSVAMTGNLDMGSNSLVNVNGISGPVFIDDDTMASASATNIASAESVKAYVDNAVDGTFKFQGAWDASAGTFPGGGTAQQGYAYKVSVAGTVDGVEFNVGDSLYAETDNASAATFAGNWARIEGVVEFDANTINLVAGYTPAAGTVAVGNSVQNAIEKLDGNIQALTTTNVAEGSNLYFTNARAIGAPLAGYAAAAGTVAATDSILQGIQKVDGNLQARVYGTEFHLFEDNAVSINTTTTFQSKISGTTGSLPVGKYKVSVSYGWNHDANGNDFESRLSFGGTILGNSDNLLHKQEPKDNAGNHSGTGSAQRYGFSQEFFVDIATAGTQAVLLEYRTDTAGVESSIWDASVEIIRVQ